MPLGMVQSRQLQSPTRGAPAWKSVFGRYNVLYFQTMTTDQAVGRAISLGCPARHNHMARATMGHDPECGGMGDHVTVSAAIPTVSTYGWFRFKLCGHASS